MQIWGDVQKNLDRLWSFGSVGGWEPLNYRSRGDVWMESPEGGCWGVPGRGDRGGWTAGAGGHSGWRGPGQRRREDGGGGKADGGLRPGSRGGWNAFCRTRRGPSRTPSRRCARWQSCPRLSDAPSCTRSVAVVHASRTSTTPRASPFLLRPPPRLSLLHFLRLRHRVAISACSPSPCSP